jgi:hypothetical protein
MPAGENSAIHKESRRTKDETPVAIIVSHQFFKQTNKFFVGFLPGHITHPPYFANSIAGIVCISQDTGISG